MYIRVDDSHNWYSLSLSQLNHLPTPPPLEHITILNLGSILTTKFNSTKGAGDDLDDLHSEDEKDMEVYSQPSQVCIPMTNAIALRKYQQEVIFSRSHGNGNTNTGLFLQRYFIQTHMSMICL